MLNVHSENHGRVRTTSNSFFQVRRHTSVVLEELEGCDTSELSLDVKEEVEDVDSNIPENRPEEVDGEVKIEVKDEDDDEEDVDNLCKQCGVVFPSEIALVKHQVDVHDRMLKVCDIGEEEVNELLSSGLNKTKVKTVLKQVRKISGKSKVQTNLMKTVNESVKYLEKYFTSEKITLIDSDDGKEFDTGVSYCKDVKGFFKYIKNNFVIYLFILTVLPSNL